MTVNETLKIIEKLIELTQHKKLIWSNYYGKISLPSNEKIDSAYVTQYLDQNIRVYKYFYQYWTDEETCHWLEDVRFEFYSRVTGGTSYAFPTAPNTKELLETIMYQNSGVENFYNQIFK